MSIEFPITQFRILGTRKSQTAGSVTPNYNVNMLLTKNASASITLSRSGVFMSPDVSMDIVDSAPWSASSATPGAGVFAVYDRCHVIITKAARIVDGATEIARDYHYFVWCTDVAVTTRGTRRWHFEGWRTGGNQPSRSFLSKIDQGFLTMNFPDLTSGIAITYDNPALDNEIYLNTNPMMPDGISSASLLELWGNSGKTPGQWWQSDPDTTTTRLTLNYSVTAPNQTQFTAVQLNPGVGEFQWAGTRTDLPSWYKSDGTYQYGPIGADGPSGSGSQSLVGRVCADNQRVTLPLSWAGYRDDEATAKEAHRLWTLATIARLGIPTAATFPAISMSGFKIVKPSLQVRNLCLLAMRADGTPLVTTNSSPTLHRYTVSSITGTILPDIPGAAKMVISDTIPVSR